MRNDKKKLIETIARWIEGESEGKESSWKFDNDVVNINPAAAIFQMWRHYHKSGELPEPGGWINQPLDVLVKLNAIQLVYDTYTYKNQKDADWKKFSSTQLEIIKQVQ